MPKPPSITPEQLRQLFVYDPSTGCIEWAKPRRSWFASNAHWNAFRAIAAGHPAQAPTHSGGYLVTHAGGEQFLTHRLVWAMLYGEWPGEQIDHIDHDRTNNRMGNLRLAPQRDNAKNASLRQDNTSGVVGVGWDHARNKWVARIGLPGGKTKALGRYDKFEDAIAVRRAAEVLYGFHPNHGIPRKEGQ